MNIFDDLFSPNKNNLSKEENVEKFGIIEEEEKGNKKVKKKVFKVRPYVKDAP